MKRQPEQESSNVLKKSKTSNENMEIHKELHKNIKENNMLKVNECLQKGCKLCVICFDIANSTNNFEFLKQLLEIQPKGIRIQLISNRLPLIYDHVHYLDRLQFMLQFDKVKLIKSLPSIVPYAVSEKVPISCLQYLIDYGFDLNSTIGDNRTPLMIASQYYIVNYIKMLLNSKSCDPNFENNDKALHLALTSQIIANDDDVLNTVKLLINAMKNPHSLTNSDGDTLLMEACLNPKRKCSTQIVKFLLKTGADIEAENSEGKTALLNVCGDEFRSLTENSPGIVETLLQVGANPNVHSDSSITPLMQVICSNNSKFAYEICKLLLNAGADVNAVNIYYYSPMHYAVYGGDNTEYQLQIVKLLIESGFIIHKYSPCPLLLAIQKCHEHTNYQFCIQVVKMLNHYGAYKCIDSNCNLLYHTVTILDGKTSLTIINDLLTIGADPNETDEDKNHVITQAISHPDPVYGPKIVEVLLRAGTTYNTSQSLFLALKSSNPVHIIRLLLNYNADPNVKNNENNSTVLNEACKLENSVVALEIVKILLESGADVNVIDNDGNTALSNVISETRSDIQSIQVPNIVKLLLNYGANPLISNNSPLVLACLTHDFEIRVELIKILTNAGVHPKLDFKTELSRFVSQNDVSRILRLVESIMKGVPLPFTKPSTVPKKKKMSLNLKQPSICTADSKNESLLLCHILNNYSKPESLDKFHNLLKLGSNPNEKCKQTTTALILACRINHPIGHLFVQKLINYGADPSLKDDYGNCPLSETLNYTTSDVTAENVRILLKAGADPNVNDAHGTPVIFSGIILNQFQNIVQLFEMLIETDKIVTDYKDCNGRSLQFHVLKFLSCDVILKLFERQFFNCCIHDKDILGYTLLTYYMSSLNYQNLKIMKLLLQLGCNAAAPNYENWTAFHFLKEPHVDDKIQLLLKYNADPSVVCDKYNYSPLLKVSMLNDITNMENCLKLLIDTGIDVNIQDHDGNTALHCIICSKYCNVEIVKYLLNHNANPNATDIIGFTPLMRACRLTDSVLAYSIVTVLLNAGADPNVKTFESGKTALVHASEQCIKTSTHFTIVELLLSTKNISTSGNIGELVLKNILQVDNVTSKINSTLLKLLKMLFQTGVVPHKDSISICYACSVKPVSHAFTIVQLLLNNGANIFTKDLYDNTTLMQICKNHNVTFEMIKFFLERGIKPEHQNIDGEDVLIILLRHLASPNNLVEIIKLILKFDGGKNIQTLDLALLYAVKNCYNCTKVIELLLENGAKPVLQDQNNGNTCLHYAVYSLLDIQNKICLIQSIISAGVDVNTQNLKGQTAIFDAIVNQDFKLISFLLETGLMNTSIQDNDGNTVLMYSLQLRIYNCVTSLLTYGVNPSLRNNKGLTAFSAATSCHDNVKIIQAMLQKSGLPSPNDIQVLFFICKCDDIELFKNMLQILIDVNMDFSVRDENGNTPIILSLQNAHPYEKLKLLLKIKNINIHSKNHKGINSIFASLNIRNTKIAYQCIVTLLKSGVNPNCCNNFQNTPLMQAVKKRHSVYGPKIVKILLDFGANTNTINRRGDNIIETIILDSVNMDVALVNLKLLTKNKQITWELFKNCIDMVSYTRNGHLLMNYLVTIAPIHTIDDYMFNLIPVAFSFVTMTNSECNQSIFGILVSSYIYEMNKNTVHMCSLNAFVRHVKRYLDIEGFSVKTISSDVISPLTSLVTLDTTKMVRNLKTPREKRMIVASLAKQFIQRGVDVHQRLFEFCRWELRTWSDRLFLPDALWVAAITGNYESVYVLLDHWFPPPLALLLFLNPDYCNGPEEMTYVKEKLRLLIPILVEGCPLPLGTEMFRQVSALFDMMVEEDLVEDQIVAKFNDMHSVVPSLTEMCRRSIRSIIPPGNNFVQKISQLCIPLNLKDLLCQPNPLSSSEIFMCLAFN